MSSASSGPGGSGPPGKSAAAQDQMVTAAHAAQDVVQQVAGTAAEQAGLVSGEAVEQARNLVVEAQRQLTRQVDQQSRRLVENLRGLCSEFRRMAEVGEPDSPATTMLKHLVDKGSRAADAIAERGPEGMVAELQSFGRRQPGRFLLAAAAAGFLAGRLAKGVRKGAASAPMRGPSGEGDSPTRPAGQPTAPYPATITGLPARDPSQTIVGLGGMGS